MNATNRPAPPQGWRWENGIGYLPPKKPFSYDEAYWEKYCQMAYTLQGQILLDLRCKMLERWIIDPSNVKLVDVGIGSGIFIETLRKRGWNAFGTDINPVALEWLDRHGWSWQMGEEVDILTFWDSLEHLPNPAEWILQADPKWIFISMPIYLNEEHCLTSKHFKPDEHIWYFTEEGLISFMKEIHFYCLEINDLETTIGGRESIKSFAFRRP
jgi:hypothetical protein